jgi:putative transposase
MIDRAHPTLSISRQCHLLNVSRASVYRRPAPVSAEDLRLMELIDRQYLAHPFYGSRRMAAWLATQGHPVNRKRVQRLMRLVAIYQRPNTSKAAPEHIKYPYLLGGLRIDRVNQVWCTDITYIPLARGFIYLVAIMDWHSRAVLAWRISNTLHADFCVDALEDALRRFGRPEIFNSERQRATGSSAGASPRQPVHQHRLHRRAEGIRISMDGKGRCMDNIFIERLWRSLKYENVYLHAYASVPEARAGIAAWLHFYNEERLHQAHGYRTPRQIYEGQCPWTGGRPAAPNGAASPASRARSGTGEMLTVAPMPTGITNNKDLEIENIAVTLRLAPTPMPGIDTAQ